MVDGDNRHRRPFTRRRRAPGRGAWCAGRCARGPSMERRSPEPHRVGCDRYLRASSDPVRLSRAEDERLNDPGSSLTVGTAVLLFVAAAIGGAINAVAGGGSFLCFPTLLLVGIPPIAANAPNTLALSPATLSDAVRHRRG